MHPPEAKMEFPFVSVIIPVYNDAERLAKCLGCLEKQTYPRQRFEIIVVDNGSAELVRPTVEAFSNATCLFEEKPGSYAARNRGMATAEGEILAFTDSDCLPDAAWIENGVSAVTAGPEGLVAGRIDVFFDNPEHPTWVELYEQEFAFRQRENVKARHYGATANVFTSRAVFDKVGLFADNVKSGGDREWGNRVFAAGLSVRYADDVRVKHPARKNVGDYFAKLRRTVHGHFAQRHLPEKEALFKVSNIVRSIAVPPLSVFVRIGQSGAPLTGMQKAKIAAFVLASRYYNNLLRLKLAVFKDSKPAPR